MNSDDADPFPRFIRIGKHAASTYKICLSTGIYLGVLLSAAAAKRDGAEPLPMALAAVGCALAGLVGARAYHLFLFTSRYRDGAQAWDTARGGAGLFGGLIAIALVSPAIAALLQQPFGKFWDRLIIAMLVGAICTRLGCFLNGCCGGKPSASWFAFRWHNHRGEQARRVPVQLLDFAWLLAGAITLCWLVNRPHAAGALALGVIAWYGLGRFLLEPLRAEPDLVFGSLRVNRVIAAALALGASAWLMWLS